MRMPCGAAVAVLAALLTVAVALALSGCSSSNPAAPALGESFLVDLTGAGDFLTIQEGLNAASDGDTVFVAPGVYAGPGNRNLDFNGVSCSLIGLATRDETVIDCESASPGFYIKDVSPVVENLVVMNGDAEYGGGMYLEEASPVLANIRFMDNRATYDGGGIFCKDGSPTLEDVLFDNNSAGMSGGGMLCINSSASLTDVVFFRNAAPGSGGGMACMFSSPTVTGTIFRRNSAGLGGALYCGASHPSITWCTFVENQGAEEGGCIYCGDGSAPTITHTIIAFSSPGEALCCDGSEPSTTRSCIYANGELNELCGSYTTSILYVDPLFRDLESGDLTLSGDSECLPENNSWGILIGALGVGCDAPAKVLAEVRRPLYPTSGF